MSLVLTIVGVFVVLLVLGLVGGYVVNLYNQLVSLENRVDQAKQNIDVLLKQRQDELGKLIDAAKETMEFEEELLTQLTKAREQVEKAETPKEQAKADKEVKQAMSEFNARFEAYPDLKSQKNMMQFQERISEIENQIADRREYYNESVTRFNTRIEQFPHVILAQQLNYETKQLFEAEEEEKKDVDVSKSFN